MKKVLVTGGAGFIGSHLCERLLNDGNRVICLDNYFTGRKENVVHLQNNARFELVQHDITSPFFAEIDETNQEQVKSEAQRELHESAHLPASYHLSKRSKYLEYKKSLSLHPALLRPQGSESVYFEQYTESRLRANLPSRPIPLEPAGSLKPPL